jgi:hypothetical protein
MTGIMCGMFSGGASSGGTHTGVAGTGTGFVGYNLSLAFGSISPTTFTAGNGGTILELDWDGGASILYFGATGVSPNSGWSTLTINGNVFNRTSASYSTAGGNTYWTWTSVSNPLVNGSPYTAVFA